MPEWRVGRIVRVMPPVPSGTVTFLFTDLQGSTRLWDEHPEEMGVALARHDELVHALIRARGGAVFSGMGDGVAGRDGNGMRCRRAASR